MIIRQSAFSRLWTPISQRIRHGSSFSGPEAQEKTPKFLSVALIGSPNAGKSTLLNQLIQHKISCVSNKVHTTRSNVLGILTCPDHFTQIEFIDVPGLITRSHCRKFSLEHTFLTDPKSAVNRCDLVAVIVDVSNVRESKALNKGVIDLLQAHPKKRSILILNKVDLIKEKRALLDIGAHLNGNDQTTIVSRPNKDISSNKLSQTNRLEEERGEVTTTKENKHRHVIFLDDDNYSERMKLKEQENSQYLPSWNGFSQLFMISALNNDGLDRLKDYLIECAKPIDKWRYDPEFITDQSKKKLVLSILRGKLLDYLQHEIPYTLEYEIIVWHQNELGTQFVDIVIECSKSHYASSVIGPKGVTITRITKEVRDEISRLFLCEVALKLIVKVVNPKHFARNSSAHPNIGLSTTKSSVNINEYQQSVKAQSNNNTSLTSLS